MFTGLVQERGVVSELVRTGDGAHLTISGRLAGELDAGGSVAVNGVCLTATAVEGESFRAEVMAETMRHSSLGNARPGAEVNLELPLRAADRIDGHLVQGHVDGVGTVREVRGEGFARVLSISADPGVLRYVVEKGAIAVDGASLTVAGVDADGFAVSLIPETLERTTLGSARAGDVVNLEVDVLAKYVEKLVAR